MTTVFGFQGPAKVEFTSVTLFFSGIDGVGERGDNENAFIGSSPQEQKLGMMSLLVARHYYEKEGSHSAWEF